jgi:hypothetical protein
MRHTSTLLVVLLVVGVAGISFAQTAPSIQGAWRVTERTVTGAAAATDKSPQPSIYLFTKQHYSIIVVPGTAARKEPVAAANPDKLTDAEKIARYDIWNVFTANTGTYQVSGSTLTTRAVVAKNPAVMGTTASREFKIDGNTLTLIQKSAAGQPASQTTTRLTRIE